METCKLCLKKSQLCKSHIIPEFVYTPLYDDKHRFFTVSSDPKKTEKIHQKGVREKLLCKDCELFLSKYEKIVSEFFKGNKVDSPKRKGEFVIWNGINYHAFRICYLSILWRMSVSKHKMFIDVKLGPHEDFIRKLVLSDDPGSFKQYGMICTVPMMQNEPLHGFILQPTRIRIYNRNAYRVIIGGLLITYIISNKIFPDEITRAYLQPDGTWMWLVKDVTDIDYLYKWLNRININTKNND